MESLRVGNKVIAAGRRGTVGFIGETSFATGEWIGVTLVEQQGKNNGTVNGIRYFDAEENHGLFVKRSQIKIDPD
ncbi:unnamed protein product, partial [Phaeothamnion confervicola]